MYIKTFTNEKSCFYSSFDDSSKKEKNKDNLTVQVLMLVVLL